jgi:hypothetical protein
MAFTLTTAANILKVRYLDPIRDQLNNGTVLLSKIGRDEQKISGKSWTVPLLSSRNVSAATAAADGGALPTAGNQGYDVAVIPNAYMYGRIQISGPTIAAARDNAGAFVRAVESEVSGLVRDTKREFNRMLNGDGTGALAYWTGADDTSGTNVDDGQGNPFVHLPNSGTITCDVIDATDYSTELASDMVVTLGAGTTTCYAITWSITTAASGTADGDYLVKAGTHTYEVMGIEGIISASDPHTLSGGLHALPVASKAFWKAQEYKNSGTKRDLSLALMQQPLTGIAVNSPFSEEDVEFMLCNYNIRDKFISLLLADKRFVNTTKLAGGFTGIDFNGIPLVPDPQCKRGTIWYIVPESMKIYRTMDFDWMDKDGAMLSRVTNYDAYEATLAHYGNLGCTARNANAVLGDLND